MLQRYNMLANLIYHSVVHFATEAQTITKHTEKYKYIEKNNVGMKANIEWTTKVYVAIYTNNGITVAKTLSVHQDTFYVWLDN